MLEETIPTSVIILGLNMGYLRPKTIRNTIFSNNNYYKLKRN